MAQTVPDVDHDLDPTDQTKVQIINAQQEFIADLGQTFLTKWNLSTQGFNYNVVAVFGSQSTGKSTLLNLLFGTQFPVMVEGVRQQTTKGIWMSKAENRNFLVMDVEGTDGRERGEDQDFERKSALFSLAVSEILIVNMWESMVGLYNGANMGLLKTVFEVNLQLFQAKGASRKTCLLFVIRDFTESVEMEKLSQTLITDLHNIWISLPKPAGNETAQLTDFFDFSFQGLPHKLYATAKFNQEVASLKSRFYDEKAERGVFKPSYHKGVPVDGFSKYAADIWDKIVHNRDLDLPTQQQLLAQYRCDEISKTIYQGFAIAIKVFKIPLEEGTVFDSFGIDAANLVKTALQDFDTDASRYNSLVYQTARADFASKLYSALHVYFIAQVRNSFKTALVVFEKYCKVNLLSDDSNFSSTLDIASKSCLDLFRKSAKASVLSDSEWQYADVFNELKKEIEAKSTTMKKEALERLAKSMDVSTKMKLTEPVACALNDVEGTDTWPKIVDILNNAIEKSQEMLQIKLSGIGMDKDMIESSILAMKMHAWDALIKTLKRELSDLPVHDKLKRKFEATFRYDEQGVPRIWKATDDIDSYYGKSKQQSDALLDTYCKMDAPAESIGTAITNHPNFDPSSLTLISPSRKQGIADRFKKETDSLFLDAKRSTTATQTSIPTWFVLLTLVLGWNEFMAILRNPMLSLIICVIVGGAYLSWYTDMGGPIVQVAKASAIEFWKQMLAKLKNYGWDLEPLFDGSLIRQAEARIKNIIHEPAQQVEEEPIKMEDMKIDRDSE